MATTPQTALAVAPIQMLRQEHGRPVLLYEDGEAVAAIVSMEDYEIVRQAKVSQMFEAFDGMHREIESNGGVDDATFAELLAESD